MRTLNDFFIHTAILNISAAGSIWMPMPDDCWLRAVYATLSGAITVGDATLTFEIGGVATGDSLVIAQAGSVAGSTFALEDLPDVSLRRIARGAPLEIVNTTGSTGVVRLAIELVMRR